MDTTQAPASQPPTEKPAEVKSQARFIVSLLILCALGALFWPKEKGKEAPGGRVEDRDGGRVELEDRYARVSLVHFWATWCLPCRDEMPLLQQYAKELSGRGDFALLMVAVADDRKKALAFIGEAGTSGTGSTSGAGSTYFDDEWLVSKSWGSRQLPETHLVVEGQVIYTFVGAQDWNDPAIRAKVQEALAAKSKAS